MNNSLIGIFGGAFNPVHNGHFHVAKFALDFVGLEKVLFVPSYISVHKHSDLSSVKHRLAMLHLALDDVSWASISLVELERKGLSYTFDTLRSLQDVYQKCQLKLIIGEDSLRSFTSWHRWADILDFCSILVIKRDCKGDLSYSAELSSFFTSNIDEFRAYSGLIYVADAEKHPASSTIIRDDVASGGMTSFKFLRPKVLDYIESHGLYK